MEMPNLVASLNRHLYLVVWCGFKNEYQKVIYLKELGLRVQNMITILDSIINIIGGGPII